MASTKRMEFEFMNKCYQFLFNPEEYTQSEPHRVQITQTKGGAFIDDFGKGVTTIYFRGTTGFKGTKNDPTLGFRKFVELRDLLRDFSTKALPGVEIAEDKELIFYNYTDEEHWVVTPKTFSLKRSVSRPMLYLYEVQLICQRPAHEPVITQEDTLSPVLRCLEVYA